MSQFKVVLVFETHDPRRPQEFLKAVVGTMAQWARVRLVRSEISVISPPHPSKAEAQIDGQLEGFVVDRESGRLYPA